MKAALLATALAGAALLDPVAGTSQTAAGNDQSWSSLQQLGRAQVRNGEFTAAVDTYTRAAANAQADATMSVAQKNAALSALYVELGNALLKLKRNDDAIASYYKGAAVSPTPGLAYFNICAVSYNIGNLEAAIPACDKAIAADPTRADAYFVKGSVLVSRSTSSGGTIVAPPGTVEALRKYLELAPNGVHASDARQMLDYVTAGHSK